MSLSSDVRHSIRAFRRTPGFTAVVVLTFALGIGANVTMFGILDRMLFRAPPHIAQPERVFVVQRTQKYQGKEFTGDRFSYPAFDDLRRGSPYIASAGASARANEIPLGRGADARSVMGLLVSDGWFEIRT